MFVDMDAIPLRDPNLTPAEILMSESQERMMAVVRPERVDAFMAICRKWDVEATVIGEVTADDTLTMTWRGGTVVKIPPRTAADGPVYQRRSPGRRTSTRCGLPARKAWPGRRTAPGCARRC